MIERELELQDFELQELEQEEPCGNPHERHRERLRARYREQGVDRFNDYELLEMLLGYVLLQKDTNGIAHELINAFGSLQGVLDAPEEKLTEINQVGPNVAFMLRLLPGIARRYWSEEFDQSLRITNSRQIMDLMLRQFIGRTEETFIAIFMDEERRLLKCEVQFVGTIDAVEVQAERIIFNAAEHGARYVVVGHNHFSDPIPSVQDVNATRFLRYELGEHGFKLLDHIVVCDGCGTSMKNCGYLQFD